jgi:hypothetical protein
MAIKFNEYQIKLGEALGMTSVDSQNDLNQINEFASRFGVTSVDSQNDLDQLLPNINPVAPPEAAPPPAPAPPLTPSPVVNPGGVPELPVLPTAAASGTSTPSDLSNLLMQQQADLKAQSDAFMAQQQQFALQQQQQYDQIKAQIEAQTRAASAVAPGAVVGSSPKDTGWTPDKKGVSTLESLLLGTQAVTGAMTKMVVA